MADDGDTLSTVDASQASSPAPDAVATPAPAEGAPSPSADDRQGEPRESLLDAVQQAVPELRSSQDDETTDAGQGASPASTATSGRSAHDADPELSDDPTPEEMARYKDGAKRRIDKLIRQRGALREENTRLKTLEP